MLKPIVGPTKKVDLRKKKRNLKGEVSIMYLYLKAICHSIIFPSFCWLFDSFHKRQSPLPSLGTESQYIQFSLLAALMLVHFSPAGHFFSGTARSCTHRINTCHYMLHAAAALGTATRTPVSMRFGSCLEHTHACTHTHTHTHSVPCVHLSVPVQEVVCDSNEVDTVDVGT